MRSRIRSTLVLALLRANELFLLRIREGRARLTRGRYVLQAEFGGVRSAEFQIEATLA